MPKSPDPYIPLSTVRQLLKDVPGGTPTDEKLRVLMDTGVIDSVRDPNGDRLALFSSVLKYGKQFNPSLVRPIRKEARRGNSKK
jgi:hypothetical protein